MNFLQMQQFSSLSDCKNDNFALMEKLFDLTNLKEIGAGDKEFICEMISLFLQHAPMAIENLPKKVAAQDWPEVRHIAHKLKPQLIYMGVHAILDEVELIEQNANKQENLDKIPAMAELTIKHCTIVIEQLKEELKRLQEETSR